ncbi:MAG TPA: Hint domain-containing protein, partial [Methylomirabilota bacterium]|nr:Hint domain-containing protein [Methylomirabilota bacterium]
GGIIVKRKGNPKEATVEAWGLVDGQPTGRHFILRVYDDVVTRESVTTAEQVKKTTDAWELSLNLGVSETRGGRERYIGTRYCTVGDTPILMADWSHKPIREVQIGDEVIGWAPREKDGKRFLKSAKVINIGHHLSQPVRKFTFSNGRSVICTKDHKWWRGAQWAGAGKGAPVWKRGQEYSSLGFGYHELKYIRELVVPTEPIDKFDAGWLSGFFDGEGTLRLNKYHSSAMIGFTQSVRNQCVIDRFKAVMEKFGFQFSESICHPGDERHSRSFHYWMKGGWRELYRFMVEINPARAGKIREWLFSQMKTDRLKLITEEDAGLEHVFWLETETGNYIANGFCSKNSLNDSYSEMLRRKAVKPRIYPATHNGRFDGNPVLLTPGEWARKLQTTSRQTIAAQQLQNPMADEDATFRPEWLRPYELRPRTLNVYIMADPSKGRGAESDNTAMAVVGIATNGAKYLLDGVCHRMTLSQRWLYLRGFYRKWSCTPGIQHVAVGYERYGAQSDDEYFQEQMLLEHKNGVDNAVFDIEELNWVREGGQSKRERVERLEPDFRNSRFYLPSVCLYNARPHTWRVETNPEAKNFQEVIYTPVDIQRPLTVAQRRAFEAGTPELIAKAIKCADQERHVYDLTVHFIEEYCSFPFGRYRDLVDATSRIYDMETIEPSIQAKLDTEPRQYWDR